MSQPILTSPDDPGAPPVADRRNDERVPILGELRGEVMVFQSVVVTEVGRRGVQIETAFPFQIESLHEFRLALGNQSIVVKGRVMHCSIVDVDQEFVRYRSGVEFVEPSERISRVVAEFVAAARKDTRPSD